MTRCINKFIDQISFSDQTKVDLNSATRGINSIGDLFLTPARYLFNGRSVTCVHKPAAPSGIIEMEFTPKEKAQPSSCCLPGLLKGAAAILLLLPCGLVGFLFKSMALVCSKNLRDKYHKLLSHVPHSIVLPIPLQEYSDYYKYVCCFSKDKIKTKVSMKTLRDLGIGEGASGRDLYYNENTRIGHLIVAFYHPGNYYFRFKREPADSAMLGMDTFVKDLKGKVYCDYMYPEHPDATENFSIT